MAAQAQNAVAAAKQQVAGKEGNSMLKKGARRDPELYV